ncbi:DegT/DnrJ/EryC1/StrS family aminotransferase [Pedobacter caeni]|uniref:dTDP-4-amino-4,6-dideoxygalactose transaminase n=1 Tax=Pedobacter caeni TaxID=288992 RepID=A0A1M5GGJ0_9SPHI|nr:DegT/DnrJ/EryC1/StrS family aminotransferase [Pedobacter caeni]SHG02808.1 dTDP-4-amino-4,6-dideoxygalactose transaminase [Pedobacter caeni]
MNIPFSPPFIDQAVIDEVLDTLRANWITTGPKVKALESELLNLTGLKAAVCVNSWTSGAIMMLNWFGVGPGDEVIVPAYTYCATALCVLHCGATPVMVDILDDFTIDPEMVKRKISARTKAIIAVDIAGLPCHYEELKALVREPVVRTQFVPKTARQTSLGRILLISDAAHSIGAIYDGKPAAQQSDITIFSFHAVKNITTAEGGCICLNLPEPFDNQEEYTFLKLFSMNGQNRDAFAKSKGANWRYDILFKGFKMNMPDICAAIGLAQIKQYVNTLMPLRKIISLRYGDAFKAHDWFIEPVMQDEKREASYHLFPLRIKGITEAQRDQLIDELVIRGVNVNVHFIPMPMLTYFKSLGYAMANFPNSYKQFANEVSLPIYPQLSDAELHYITDAVIECVQLVKGTETLVKVLS